MSTPSKPTSIRLDADVRRLLDAWCGQHYRSLSQAVNLLLREALMPGQTDPSTEE